MKRIVASISAVFLFLGCSKSDSSGDSNPPPGTDDQVFEAPLTGVFSGNPWEVKTSWVTKIDAIQGRDESYRFQFSDQMLDSPCDPFSSLEVKNFRKFMLSANLSTGRQNKNLNSGGSVTFVVAQEGQTTQNFIGNGWLQVDSFNRRDAVGKVYGEYSGLYKIAGSFKMKICPPTSADPETDFVEDKERDPNLLHAFKGFDPYLGSDWSHEMKLAANGTGSLKVFSDNDTFEDSDFEWKLDSGLDNPRIIFKT
ncbi:MAG: hypothetical protein NT027_11810, partial [Proteobacteria bacterium]|nr:hypothetical protein [Pseudomonadota bacterium]